MSARLVRYMFRRGGAILWVLFVAGMLAIPALSDNVRQLDAGAPDPISGSKTSIDAPDPAIAPPASRHSVSAWVEGRRHEQRSYPPLSIPGMLVLAVATLLALETLRSSHGWHARFLVTGRAVSSRAPPGLAFA